MAKALKTVAIVAGVTALAFTGVGLAVGLGAAATSFGIGVSASTLFLASAGASIAAGLLQKAPKVPTSQTDRLTASIDPRAFRKTILGSTAWPVDVRFEEWSGKDQEYCDWIVAHGSHASDGIDEIWFNTEMAWSAKTGVVGKYAGYFSVPHIVLEGSAANAFSIGSGRWNQSARLTGCTYSHWRFKVTGNSKKAESPFSSGLPSRITVIGRGAKLYDPRRDSTVPGGNGPMRANDQSTWRYTADDGVVIGENLALHVLRVVLGWRIRNPSTGEMKLATGSGVPARRLDLGSFIVAANLCDEQVNRSAGGTEPRYHGASVLSEGDDAKTVLDMLCAGCCGRFRDTGGKLALVISHNDLALAAVDDGLNDDDVIGAFNWNPDAALESVPNVIRGKYVDPTSNSLYQMIDYPEVRLDSLDGQDRIFPLDLGAVESPSHAQRVAKQILQRKQYPREFTAPFDIRAWKYAVGDPVPFTFAPLSFTRALFRVKEQELGQNGTCNMTLTYESATFYQWDASDAPPVQAAAAIVYDSSNSALIQAIDEAGGTANWSAVADDDGKKPEDNATVGAPPGTNVGDRPAVDVVKQIDKARADIDGLVASVGEGQTDLSAQVSAANAARDASQTARDQSQAARDAAQSASTLSGAARDAAQTAKTAAESAATTATQKASDAGGYASTATGQATIATQKADAAGQSASSASANATTATTKAGEASQSAASAVTAKNDAAGSATSAGTSAGVAAQAKTDAQAAAGAASTSASTASSRADAAGQSATAAAGSATAASTKAGEASTSAGAASTSALNALGSSNSAATSANLSAVALAQTLPQAYNPSAFSFVFSGKPSAISPVPSGWGTDTYYQDLNGSNNSSALALRSVMPVVPGKIIEMTASGKGIATSTYWPYACFWLNYLDADYNLISEASTFAMFQTPAAGFNVNWSASIGVVPGSGVTDVLTPPANAKYVRFGILINRFNPIDGRVVPGAVTRVDQLSLVDATEKRNAAISASAANASSSTAAASATASGQSASAADASRIAAQTARGGAEAARDTAVTSASNAAGSANTAASSQTLATNASGAAVAAAAAALPYDFNNDGLFWRAGYAGNLADRLLPAAGWQFVTADVGRIAQTTIVAATAVAGAFQNEITTFARIAAIPGRRYRLTLKYRFVTSPAGNNNVVMYLLNNSADGASHLDSVQLLNPGVPRLNTWETFTAEVVVPASWGNTICPFARAYGGAGANFHVAFLRMDDITSETASAGYAGAANTSASSASASAGAAGNSATAANQARIDAQAANGAAQNAASAANTSAVSANASASQAQTSATLSAVATSSTIPTDFSQGGLMWMTSYAGTWEAAKPEASGWTFPTVSSSAKIARSPVWTGGDGSESGTRQFTTRGRMPLKADRRYRLTFRSGLSTYNGQGAISYDMYWLATDADGVTHRGSVGPKNVVYPAASNVYTTVFEINGSELIIASGAQYGGNAGASISPFVRMRGADGQVLDIYEFRFEDITTDAKTDANAAKISQVNDALATQYGSLAQRVSSTEATAGDLVARTGITETSVADLRTKQAAARLVLGATSPGGNPTITIRSDSVNGGAIDFGADTNFVGDLKVQKNKGGNVISIDSDHGFIITAPNGVRVIELTVD